MVDTQRIPYLIGALGALLAAVLAGEAIALFATGEGITPLFVVSVLTTSPFIGACLYAGRWIHRSDVEPSRYHRVGGWVLGGMVGFVSLNVLTILLMLPMPGFFIVG